MSAVELVLDGAQRSHCMLFGGKLLPGTVSQGGGLISRFGFFF